MVLAESKNRVGLGRALMNSGRNVGAGRAAGPKGKRGERTGPVKHYSTDIQKEYGSITEQAALDEFLATAELADTDFTAEKLNIQVIHNDQKNPYLLTAEEESKALHKQAAHSKHLTVPRRPEWDSTTTPQELDRLEKAAFLQWRRGLAELQENKDLLMTPFERNLEMWRQLWRVIERSDLVVQIVDARNPLLFRCEDLEHYVKEVDPRKENLLLINKADMMTEKQRLAWAEYFEEAGIQYTFFSAALAGEMQRIGEEDLEEEEDVQDEDENEAGIGLEMDGERTLVKETEKLELNADDVAEVVSDDEEDDEEDSGVKLSETSDTSADPRIRILTVNELEELFLKHAPPPKNDDLTSPHPRKTTIGLVGYPNVGKSSTINALTKAKKVSVSATPGKTKHFQTIHLSSNVILCDCPGLVFPNFASTKAELVCNGILSIDQLREFTGPTGLVARRIPKEFLEAVYGIKIDVRPLEEGGTSVPTAEEVLRAYAKARGFMKTGMGGEPDEARAARYILKDYVKGKLLWCQPPPGEPKSDPAAFNRELYTEEHLPTNRQGAGHMIQNNEPLEDDVSTSESGIQEFGFKSTQLDRQFFGSGMGGGMGVGNAGHLKSPFQRTLLTNGKQISGRKAKAVFAAENGLTMEEAGRLLGGKKKHYKGKRRFM